MNALLYIYFFFLQLLETTKYERNTVVSYKQEFCLPFTWTLQGTEDEWNPNSANIFPCKLGWIGYGCLKKHFFSTKYCKILDRTFTHWRINNKN